MLQAINLNKAFGNGSSRTPVLRDVSLSVAPGEFVAVVGRSGSGKTTLLNCMSSLLAPDSGRIEYQGRDLATLSEHDRNALRRADFAVVFQMHYLLPYLTALENVVLPFMAGLAPVPAKRIEAARQALDRVGLAGKHKRLPGELSGGEQQRVAIARALVKSSRILFADEPTGSLDKHTGEDIMNLISELHADGLGVVMVTHEWAYAGLADRIVEMEDGRVKTITQAA